MGMTPSSRAPSLLVACTPSEGAKRGRAALTLDVGLILLFSFALEAVFASPAQGRAISCGDSLQHVDGALALLDPAATANFGFRKPGYTLLLAFIAWLTGRLSWHVVVLQHIFLALLPLGAYFLGRSLQGRWAGRLAAALVLAELQTAVWGNRIMSEPLYALLLTFGLVALIHGLQCQKGLSVWLAVAGGLLGMAWLTRSVAVVVVGVAGAAVVCTLQGKRRWAAVAALGVPIMLAMAAECGLNWATQGRFRPSTGGVGTMVLTRARYLDGSPLPRTPTVERLKAWLPERSWDEAFLANMLDVCIARAHALREGGLDDWAFDAIAKKAGLEVIAADPWPWVKVGAVIFWHQMSRSVGDDDFSSAATRLPIPESPMARNPEHAQSHWYAYWFVPERSAEASLALSDQMDRWGGERSPLLGSEFFKTGRYALTWSPVEAVLKALRGVAAVGVLPAMGLLLLVGGRKGPWVVLAVSIVLEALLVAAVGSTETANRRYQFPWLAVDAALMGAAIAATTAAVRRGVEATGTLRVAPRSFPGGAPHPASSPRTESVAPCVESAQR